MLPRPGPGPLAASAALTVLLIAGCAGEPAQPPADGAGAASPAGSVPAAATSPAPSPSATVPATDAQQIELTIRDGQVSGDTGRVEIALGTRVRMTLLSDVADEVHVHGYDQVVALAPGVPAEVDLVADTPGVFEVELHDTRLLLTRLQVR